MLHTNGRRRAPRSAGRWRRCSGRALAAALVLGGVAPAQLGGASDPTYRGILVFGQSNAIGPNLGPRDAGPGGLDALPPNVFCLDRADRVVPWHLPFPYRVDGFDPGNAVNVSAAMAFAKRIGEQFPEDRFCVILAARGNTHFAFDDGDPLGNWAAPSSSNYIPGNLYDDTVERAAVAAAQGVEIAYYVGQLGETDSKWSTAEDFEAEYCLLIEGFREEIGPGSFVLGTLPQWLGPFGDMGHLDPAIDAVGAGDPGVVVASADGLVSDDPNDVHFNAPSARVLGGRMVDALTEAELLHDASGAVVLPALAPTYGPQPCGCLRSLGKGEKGVVLWQDFTLGGWFDAYSGALAADAPARGRISHVDRFEEFRRPTGEFVLRATWSTGEAITWSQTSNPLLAARDLVVGFTPIDDPLLLGPSGLVGGLCRTSITGALFSLVPGSAAVTTPVLGQFITGDAEWAIGVGAVTVVPSPLGLLASSVTLEAL